jgi:starch synthase
VLVSAGHFVDTARDMKVLHVASEVAPLSKTGGLGDVLGALPRALCQTGEASACVVSARYGSLNPGEFGMAQRLRKLSVPLAGETYEVSLYEGRLPGPGANVPLYLIDHPLFSERAGIYGPPDEPGHDYSDNWRRFALLSRAALSLASTFDLRPDVVHAHDWPTAMAIYYARTGQHELGRRLATVFTVHNLLFKGLCSLTDAASLGVNPHDLGPEGVEFWGQAAFIKAGLKFAHRITTVSPTYASEIRTSEFGYGLEGVMAALGDRLIGILNGADYDRWSPWSDPYLPARYGLPPEKADGDDEKWAQALAGKARCKSDLQRELGLSPRPRTPLLATISRLTDQKGIDLICTLLDSELLAGSEFQWVILGRGEPWLEERLRGIASRYPSRVALRLAFDEALSHRTEGGADFFVMPSRFEPCGLNQLYSMRYGTPPIVRSTGGLADTIVDYDARSKSGTGFCFTTYDAGALAHTIRRALSAYTGDPAAFLGLMRRAMRADFSWAQSARAYLHVYKQALLDSHGG